MKFKNTIESITSRLYQAEERIPGIEDNIKQILHSDNKEEKN
jgi:hypothetical protein